MRALPSALAGGAPRPTPSAEARAFIIDPVQLTWLGQAGFVVETADGRVLIDPFLSDSSERAYPPPDRAPYVRDVLALLITHDHPDHLDVELLPELVKASPAVKVVVPTAVVPLVTETVPEVSVVGLSTGESHMVAPTTRVVATPAYHAVEATDPFSDGDEGSGPRFVGYVVSDNETTLYHSGDTIVTAALRRAVGAIGPQIALLPVNGRDFYREELGLVGNMDAREAVQLAAEIGARVLVPIHWDLFKSNAVRPASVVDEAISFGPALHVLVPARYVPLRLG
jgi:L-ascorbate metabolism protein UlaG (beta-lactamase superfamily)